MSTAIADAASANKRKELPQQSAAAAAAVSVDENRRITLSPNENREGKNAVSPYEARQEEFSQIRQQRSAATGEEYVIAVLSDPLTKLSKERLDEVLGETNMKDRDGDDDDDYEYDDDLDELGSEERTAALQKLTQTEVDQFVRVMILPEKFFELETSLSNSILLADPRNDPPREDGSLGMIMLNTYSTWCMYPVIGKMLTKAARELNAAIKRAGASSTAVPNVAASAFTVVAATIMAVNGVDHWRCDYEEPEENEKIAKRVLKLAKDLLWFQDSELGLTDPYTRQGLLHLLTNIANDWLGGASKLKVPKNGYGKGRDLAASATSAPAAKKQKVTMVQGVGAAAAGDTGCSDNNNNTSTGLLDYLNFLSPAQLQCRVKTVLQLKITDLEDPEKNVLVLVSGATHAKKLSQLVAYLTGHTSDFRYHPQKGSNLKGSRIELTDGGGGGKMWLAEKSAAKKAIAAGASLAIDKDVKVVQLFQGLTMGTDTGIAWDSQEAKTFGKSTGFVVWVAPENNKRYDITVQAVVPNKCRTEHEYLPRVVTHQDLLDNEGAKTGFGKPIKTINLFLRDGRQYQQGFRYFGIRTAAEERRVRDHRDAIPLCDNEDGTACLAGERSFTWQPGNINSAGPPSNPVY